MSLWLHGLHFHHLTNWTNETYFKIENKEILGYEQTERQQQRQASAAAAPMLVNGDATHDAFNGSCTHSQNLPLDPAARSVHSLRFLELSGKTVDNEFAELLFL